MKMRNSIITAVLTFILISSIIGAGTFLIRPDISNEDSNDSTNILYNAETINDQTNNSNTFNNHSTNCSPYSRDNNPVNTVNKNIMTVLFQDFDEDTGWGDQFGSPPFMPIQGLGNSTPFNVAWDTSHPADYFWQDASLSDVGSPHSASRYAYSYTNSDSMITPAISLGDGTNVDDHVLSFWYGVENSNFPQSLEVYVNRNLEWSDDGFTNEVDDSKYDNGYIKATVSLLDYAQQEITIEFINSGDTQLYGQFVDTVEVVTTISEDDDQELPDIEVQDFCTF
jgi:hypothetical protein